MNKKEVLEKIKNSKINLDECVLGNSAALVLYGIMHECNDIDLRVSCKEFEKIIHSNLYDIKISYCGDRFISIDKDFDIFESYDKTKDINTINIEGIKCFNLEYIKNWYAERGRSKDLEKLKIINRKGEILI